MIPTALLSGGNEEPGWRGYITPVLLNRFNMLLAHIIVGIFWALWHLPLYLLGDWGGDDQPMVWLVIYCIPLSMILTWLYYKSKRSVIPAMLFHGGSNVVFQYFPMKSQLFANVEDEFTLIKTLLYWLIAIILLIVTKGTLGYKKEKTDL
jgi:membrane protease YdiL (CAAX protease family)